MSFGSCPDDVHRVWRSIIEERLRSCSHQAGEITRFERFAVHDGAFLNTLVFSKDKIKIQ